MAKAPETRGPMTKSALVSEMAENLQVNKAVVNQFFDLLAVIAYDEAKFGFTIPGIGKLVIVDRKARMGRNPATGQTIKIPAKRVLKFRIAKACKDTATPAKKKK